MTETENKSRKLAAERIALFAELIDALRRNRGDRAAEAERTLRQLGVRVRVGDPTNAINGAN